MGRQRRSNNRKQLKEKPKKSNIPLNVPITLDMLTDPNNK